MFKKLEIKYCCDIPIKTMERMGIKITQNTKYDK